MIAGLLALATVAVLPDISTGDGDGCVDLQTRLEDFIGLVPGAATAITVRDGKTCTAATGILDDRGGPVDPETPFLVGPLGMPMTVVVVLQLVDDGRIELDEPVRSYLPDAPVPPDATVRQLLDWRAGVPDTYGQMIDLTLEDMGRGWTRQELADLLGPAQVGVAGDFGPTIGNEIIAELLVEAVAGADFGSILAERISEPLGLTRTVDIEGDASPPPGLAIGWELELGMGLAGDPGVPQAGVRTLDGRISSVTDTATFLQALVDGELLSDELTEVVFDEEAVFFGMGFDSHEVALGHLGDPAKLGTRYYLSSGNLISGYSGSLAVSPETGDLVVVLASNDELPTWEFVHDTVSAWTPASEE